MRELGLHPPPDAIQVAEATPARATRAVPWPALALRPAAFALAQAALALALAIAGSGAAWLDATAWWMLTAAAVDLAYLPLALRVLRARGERSSGAHRWGAALRTLALAGSGALAVGVGLGWLLWAEARQPLLVLVQPLAREAAWAALAAHPALVALVEIPLYYAGLPSRASQGVGRAWFAALAVALLHAAQFAAIPLVLDARFALWRFATALPVTLALGWIALHRPRLLPVAGLGYALLQLPLALLVLSLS